ncbi:uncharacterized protein LOC119481846 isoform X1 [Sebastes umbrosus]|uniref:uncharacterized protein LOC119481846 isoform X1 n=1 Tax=Sebastes umbrosus TaxID=72105 RepID=UPI00189D92C2|nr:uncharacterized protein LOC119481846 isoform X1 [Sebastes umbrosus]
MKMICSILLLLSLTSCVSGAFVVNVTQTSYQAEENHNITLEWMFTTRTNSSSKSLFIICLLSAEPRPLVLFHLREGVEDPESQDEQFTGRVRWDKDVLRDGRIRLHMSRLRINDSGWYQCDVQTGDGRGSEICHLKVTGAFVVNVKQTSYQAEENHNITLEWMFTTRTNSSPKSLFIYCELFAERRPLVLFHLLKGVENPETQDKQFAGRVLWDKDVLRDGRLRLHMSRLRIDDSGVYRCLMQTGDGTGSRMCHLNVTAAADEPKPLRPTMRPEPERPTMRPQPESRGRISLYVGLTALLVLCAGLCFAFHRSFTKSIDKRGNINTGEQMMSFLEEQSITTNQAVTSSAEIRSCLEGNLQAPRKKCENSCKTLCPTTYPNLNCSRSIPNLNYLISMLNLNHSRSIPKFNHSRSMPNLNSSSLYEEFIIKI